ncbi:hypothetical protein MGSAQ_001635 [marine sediment metagenome]|uniref:Uncharacterized protein n=1 Tax=marine sediment metagenome TaxID=412755 RepID=A0A1B6NTS1_9ZZZZ
MQIIKVIGGAHVFYAVIRDLYVVLFCQSKHQLRL